jgi:hypothetical protein
MTTDREAAEVVRSWMKEEIQLDDAGIHRVLARLPDTPQRRHRWLWPFDWRPFGPGAARRAGSDAPPVIRRINTMFNAIRVAAVMAALALAGSLLLVSTDLGRPADPDQAPAAPAPGGEAIAHVTGEQRVLRQVSAGEVGVEPGGVAIRGATWEMAVSADDPRLDGLLSVTQNEDSFEGSVGTRAISGSARLDTDDGSWVGTYRGIGYPDTNDLQYQSILRGEGAHAGLTVVLYTTNYENELVLGFEGIIFPGEMPEYP